MSLGSIWLGVSNIRAGLSQLQSRAKDCSRKEEPQRSQRESRLAMVQDSLKTSKNLALTSFHSRRQMEARVPKEIVTDESRIKLNPREVQELVEVERRQPSQQVAGLSEWGLQNPEKMDLVLERLAHFRVGEGDVDSWEEMKSARSVRDIASWGRENLSSSPEIAKAQGRGLLTVLSALGSEKPTTENLRRAAEQLLRLNFSQAAEQNRESLAFSMKAIRRMVNDSNDAELRGELHNTRLENGGRSGRDPVLFLIGLAAKGARTGG